MRKQLIGLLGAILLSLALATPGAAFDLGRRALLGITAAPAPLGPDSIGRGVLAERVITGSAAAQAGVVAGDVLLSVGGKPLAVAEDLVQAVRTHRAGDRVTVELRRAGQPLTIAITLGGWPLETAPGVDFVYDAVETPTGLRRTIMTTPRGSAVSRLPAVLLIGASALTASTIPSIPITMSPSPTDVCSSPLPVAASLLCGSRRAASATARVLPPRRSISKASWPAT